MAVHVRVVIERASGETLSCSVLLNGGFESRFPELLLPAAAAERLFAQYPAGTVAVTGIMASGEAQLLQLPENVSVRVTAGDLAGRRVRFGVLVSAEAGNVLVSDTGIDALGVRIESFGRGLWRFANERRVRKSTRRQDWPRARGR